MSDSIRVKLIFNPRSEQYDLMECSKCGAYILAMTYARHITTKKHLNAKHPLPPKKVDDVSPLGKKAPFKVEQAPHVVRF